MSIRKKLRKKLILAAIGGGAIALLRLKSGKSKHGVLSFLLSAGEKVASATQKQDSLALKLISAAAKLNRHAKKTGTKIQGATVNAEVRSTTGVCHIFLNVDENGTVSGNFEGQNFFGKAEPLLLLEEHVE